MPIYVWIPIRHCLLVLLSLYYYYDEMNLHSLFIYQYSLHTHITSIEFIRFFGYHVYVYVYGYVWDFVMIILAWVEIHIWELVIRDFSGGERIDLAKGVSWDTLRNTCGGCRIPSGKRSFGNHRGVRGAIPVIGANRGPSHRMRTGMEILASATEGLS